LFFFLFFSKDSLKYGPYEKILKNGPFAWRHSRWRQDITAWRHHPWRQDTANVTTVAFDVAVLGAQILGANDYGAMPWRQNPWR
jgi:hypothetical protein